MRRLEFHLSKVCVEVNSFQNNKRRETDGSDCLGF